MKYWWAAFNARPFGMPIPPNWFGLAAFGMLGAFIHPGLWLIGAGLELAYLKFLSGAARFRKTVDATSGKAETEVDPQDTRYDNMLAALNFRDRQKHQSIEAIARDILSTLEKTPLFESQGDSVEQLVWLHLRLLSARAALIRVGDNARVERDSLIQQHQKLDQRLQDESLSPELRRSLEQQQLVIGQRQQAHADAARRLEQVDAELVRVDHQMALIREQTLLASDDGSAGASLNALSASFNDTQRWLSSQRDLFDAFESGLGQKLPKRVLARRSNPQSEGET
ncbi:hypothetical protein C7S18_05840 [Ahniella affigens]|uniref:Uncharacterized protein n=1 Tax=Ahniella affigens TaxID=2021234 RepID=A0A2P1PPK2_9GAMM|nr:hypothetical protein [Ahniella affigens]AVP96748.1 hypothetical protein C7S18_05840 [Ahniella affigens]